MTVVREIDSYMHNLNKVFLEENKNFHIPDFQRDFVWTDEEANELFKDFSEDSNNFETETSQLQGYLLGNIVLIDSGSKSLVVDGQQRLTTLSLIFKALYETVKNKAFDITNSDQAAWLGRLGELNKGFIRVDDAGEFIGLRITHEPTLPFGGYYKDLIRDTPNLEAKTISDENIESVYSSVLENIESLNDIQLNRFITYLRTKVKLIVTTAPSQSKAFQLFEVLNDRGRSLEPLDLVKNLFLKQLTTDGYNTEDLTQFNSNWTNFIKNLEISPKRKIASSTFMKHFVTAEYAKNIKQNTLFEFFDNKGDERSRIQSNEILNFSRKLVKTSEIYRDIEKKPF